MVFDRDSSARRHQHTESRKPPPPAPIPIPSPALNARGVSDPIVEPDDDEQVGAETDQESTELGDSSGGANFVDGLVRRLKRYRRSRASTNMARGDECDREVSSASNNPPGPHDDAVATPGKDISSTPTAGLHQAPAQPPIGDYISRAHEFLKEINDLPWVSPRSTVDYIPGQSNRRRRFSADGPSTKSLSWYSSSPQKPMTNNPGNVERRLATDSSIVLLSPGSPPCDNVSPPQPLHVAPQAIRHRRSYSLQMYGPLIEAKATKDDHISLPPPARMS